MTETTKPQLNRPNVVLILADDLGYSDLGCYGGEIRTPALDRLGRAGVRLTQFRTTPRCSPSRASLMTGLFPHQTGIGDLTRDDRPWGYPGSLTKHCVTLAEALAGAGYATSLSGKWHLSGSAFEPDGAWPTRRGFDEFYGIINGSANYFGPRTLMRGETPSDDPADPDFYLTDAIADQAAEFITRQASAGRPFFSYVAFTAPHFPLQAPAADIAGYDGVYDAGWEELRRARLSRMIDEGLLPADTELGDREPGRPDWDDDPNQKWQAARMQVFAAQVDRMDRGIGRIVAALEDSGSLDDTLVVFLSDNGGCAEPAPPPPPHERRTRDGRDVRAGNDPSVVPGTEDTHTTYGPDWAALSNTPFRLYKRWAHEGGIATPFIAHWPAGGLADGTVVDHPYQATDLYPTVLAAAGVPLPDAPGPEAPRPQGRVMLPSLRADTAARVGRQFWEHIGNCAVRDGRWKLVRVAGGLWELYDLPVDRVEAHDLAAARPDIVAHLAREWQAWADRVGVIPFDSIAEDYRRNGRYRKLDHTGDR